MHASIHNNLSAGAQNVTGAYVIMLVYKLVNNTLIWQSNYACGKVIMLVYRHGKAAV